jgi:glyoxylate utilization-related uncharacterized protein
MKPNVDMVSASHAGDTVKTDALMQVMQVGPGAVIVWAETRVLEDVALMTTNADTTKVEKCMFDRFF